MPQGEHIKLHRQRHGYRLDYHEKKRKREARCVAVLRHPAHDLPIRPSLTVAILWAAGEIVGIRCRLVHKRSAVAQKTLGLKGKLLSKKRHAEKATMKKTIAMHQQRDNKHKAEDGAPQNALPAYLLERDQVRLLKNCSQHSAEVSGGARLVFSPPQRSRAAAGGPRQGSQQYDQAEAEAEGWKMGGPSAQGKYSLPVFDFGAGTSAGNCRGLNMSWL